MSLIEYVRNELIPILGTEKQYYAVPKAIKCKIGMINGQLYIEFVEWIYEYYEKL